MAEHRAQSEQSRVPSPRSLSEAQWRSLLSPEEYRVLREAGTEPPWQGEYVTTSTPGRYLCRACGAELFSSADKFEGHCGWPSFDQALPGAVRYVEDASHGMVRIEIRCAACDSHLGHRFDGERFTPANVRHCVNSLSLILEPDATDPPVGASAPSASN